MVLLGLPNAFSTAILDYSYLLALPTARRMHVDFTEFNVSYNLFSRIKHV